MDYNDFPILSDEQYNFLQNKFENLTSPFNRKETAFKFYTSLIECCSALPFVKEKANFNIKKSLDFCLVELNKIVSNLNATFNFSSKTTQAKEINIFGLLKKICNSINIVVFWLKFEQKEYFKQYSLNILCQMTTVLFEISSALQTSQVNIFKFM